MTYKSSDTAPDRKRHRRLWPLAAALWTAVGLSPCALAAVGNLDCLHCPVEDASSGHAGHGKADTHDMHRGHGDDVAGHAAVGSDCGDDCGDSGDSLVDARGFKSTSKDAGDVLAVPFARRDFAQLRVAARTTGLDPPRHNPVRRERPHALFCVYLD
jgi:hypothetical protein